MCDKDAFDRSQYSITAVNSRCGNIYYLIRLFFFRVLQKRTLQLAINPSMLFDTDWKLQDSRLREISNWIVSIFEINYSTTSANANETFSRISYTSGSHALCCRCVWFLVFRTWRDLGRYRPTDGPFISYNTRPYTDRSGSPLSRGELPRGEGGKRAKREGLNPPAVR